MTIDRMTVEIDATIKITEETARRAMQILEWYCNDKKCVVVPWMSADGEEVRLRFEENPTLETCPCCGQSINRNI